MNFKEMLNCFIEREEHIQTELAKPDSETLEERLFSGNIALDRKIDEKGDVYFIAIDIFSYGHLPLLLTPEQMKTYISYENPKWNKEIEKMIRENPNDPLHEILYIWFRKNPRITDKMLYHLCKVNNEHLSKKGVQDEPFDMYIPQDIFNGESWYGMLRYFMELPMMLDKAYKLIEDKAKRKLLSRFDYFVVLFREELGVRSLKEIKSLESAICYLIYRKDWIDNYQKKTKMPISKWSGNYEGYLEYIEENPHHSTFDFIASRNGFKGELWGSYEEFIHDEWLDDEFLETFNDNFEFYAKLYRDLRNVAFHKK